MDLSQHTCDPFETQNDRRIRLLREELHHLMSTRARDYQYFKEVYAERNKLRAELAAAIKACNEEHPETAQLRAELALLKITREQDYVDYKELIAERDALEARERWPDGPVAPYVDRIKALEAERDALTTERDMLRARLDAAIPEWKNCYILPRTLDSWQPPNLDGYAIVPKEHYEALTVERDQWELTATNLLARAEKSEVERDALKVHRENCAVCECNIKGVASALETLEAERDALKVSLAAEKADSRHGLVEQCAALEAERNKLKTDLFAAKRTSNYWKSEHLTGNGVIEHLKDELALARGEAIRQMGYREMRDAYASENVALREQATRLEAELEVERIDSHGLGALCNELEDKCNQLEREYKAARAKAERNSELAWRTRPGGTS